MGNRRAILPDFTHVEVATLTMRNIYPLGLRKWGMRITVTDDPTPVNNSTYVLTKGLVDNDKTNNDNWQLEANIGDGLPIEIDYLDIAEMLADQANQENGKWYRVADASADPDVTSGWAIYEYLGTTNGNLSDYYFILDQESLNLTIADATPFVKGVMKLYTTLGVNVDGTVDQATIKANFDLKEDLSNKVITMTGNEASDTKYLSAKAVYTWGTATFVPLTTAALSVKGNATNAPANASDITAAADYQILRRSGTSIGFGSIDLSQAGAVGVSVLGVANGGTGTSTAFTAGSVVFAGALGVYAQNNAKYFWDNVNETLFLGANSTVFTGVKLNSIGTVNSYLQNNIQNLSNGAVSSSDWIATADDGTDVSRYIDLGINSSGWAGAGMIDGQRQGYLYTKDVPLSIGTDGATSLKFFTGGTAAANERVSITSAGVYTFTGSSTAIHKEIFTALGVTQTNGAGLWLANTTAAALGAQQISPSLVLEGQAWNTTSNASQSAKYMMDVLPVQGTTIAATWKLKSSLNGAAYIDALVVSGPGHFAITNGTTETARFSQNGVTLTFGGSGTGFVGINNAEGPILGTSMFGMQYRAAGGASGASNVFHSMVYSGSGFTAGWAATYRILKLNTLAGTVIAPVSGSGGWINLEIATTYNVTGTATGTIHGVYYNPTTTSMTGIDHKAWEHNSGYIQWNSVLTPSQITSNQNDYNPAGWNNGGAPNGASILRLDTNASRNLTSLTGGISGRLSIIANFGSNDLKGTKDDGATGTAANRLAHGFLLRAGMAALMFYDDVTDRWRPINACTMPAGGSAPATNAIGAIADYFGTSATRVLTTPNTWLEVVGTDGNVYKIPGYS